MKKLLAIFFSLSMRVTLFAQGWVIDEVSKDDSGGIFSGIMGVFLLIGLVWFIGYIMDKKSEDRDIRKRRKTRLTNKEAITKTGVKLVDTRSKTEAILSRMLLYDGKDPNCFEDNLDKKEVPLFSPDYSFINNEINNYALTKIGEEEWDKASKNWGKQENEEYENWCDGQAVYSIDGKKILDFEDRTDGHKMKESVEIICDEAFQRMPNSWKGPFPSSLKILGNCLYSYHCDNHFIIPKSVEIITGNPFAYCLEGQIECMSPHFIFDKNGIMYDIEKKKVVSVMWDFEIEDEDVRIDPHVIMIGRFSFHLVIIEKNKTLVIPPSVLYIADSAFKSSWINVVLSEGIVELGNSAFAESHISDFVLPFSISKVGIGAFESCVYLERITLSPNLEVLNTRTFWGCKKLNHIYIPNGVKVIKNSCFEKCETLNEIWLPNSIERIEKYAFGGCPLPFVVISKKTIVEEEAFPSNCKIIYRD